MHVLTYDKSEKCFGLFPVFSCVFTEFSFDNTTDLIPDEKENDSRVFDVGKCNI